MRLTEVQWSEVSNLNYKSAISKSRIKIFNFSLRSVENCSPTSVQSSRIETSIKENVISHHSLAYSKIKYKIDTCVACYTLEFYPSQANFSLPVQSIEIKNHISSPPMLFSSFQVVSFFNHWFWHVRIKFRKLFLHSFSTFLLNGEKFQLVISIKRFIKFALFSKLSSLVSKLTERGNQNEMKIVSAWTLRANVVSLQVITGEVPNRLIFLSTLRERRGKKPRLL